MSSASDQVATVANAEALVEADVVRAVIQKEVNDKRDWPQNAGGVLKFAPGAIVFEDVLDIGGTLKPIAEQHLPDSEPKTKGKVTLSLTKSVMSSIMRPDDPEKSPQSVMSKLSADYAILVAFHERDDNKLRIVGTSESLMTCFKTKLEEHIKTRANEILTQQRQGQGHGQGTRQGQGQGTRKGQGHGTRQGQGQGTRQGQGQGKTVAKHEAQEMALKGLQAGKKHKNWQQSGASR